MNDREKINAENEENEAAETGVTEDLAADENSIAVTPGGGEESEAGEGYDSGDSDDEPENSDYEEEYEEEYDEEKYGEEYHDDAYYDEKYYKERITFQRIIIRLLCVVLALILIVVAVAGIYLNSKLDLINYRTSSDGWQPVSYADGYTDEGDDDEVSAADADFDGSYIELPEEDVYTDKNVINILILGTDERSKDFSAGSRADSIMVLSIDKKKNTLKLISIERGITVRLPDDSYNILTHAFHYGGPEWVLDCVQRCFNLDVQKYIRINFNVFKQLVDAVGGVDIELTDAEARYLNKSKKDYENTPAAPVQSGWNHMDGTNALRYCRLRKLDSDWSRIERQRATVKSIQKQCREMSVSELDDLLDIALPMIQTNLSKTELTSLILYLPSLVNTDIDDMTIPVKGTYQGTKHVDFKANSEILREFFYGSDEE